MRTVTLLFCAPDWSAVAPAVAPCVVAPCVVGLCGSGAAAVVGLSPAADDAAVVEGADVPTSVDSLLEELASFEPLGWSGVDVTALPFATSLEAVVAG